LSVLSFDELNRLEKKRRSEPIDEYYEPMHISRQRKNNRIRTAEKYRDAVLAYMHFIDEYAQYGYIDIPAKQYLHDGILSVVEDVMIADRVLRDYADRITSDIHDATMRNKEKDPYFLSEDRATFIGEDESNALWNYEELQEALDVGMTRKTWNTVGDRVVRDTHKAVRGKTIPIEKAFSVGEAMLMTPRDPEVDAPEETVNCRCWLTFS